MRRTVIVSTAYQKQGMM